MKILKTYTIVLLAIISFGSCGPDAVEEVEFSDLFQNVADNVIVPRYNNFDNALSDLNSELNNFDLVELSSLEALQQKFIAAYLSWQTVSAFEFGPADETSAKLRININTFPTNYSKIESNIQSNEYNLDAASNYSAKGLPALDYILFHASQDELLLELANASRVNYMKECVSDMKSRVDYVVNAWDAYRNVFVGSEGNDPVSYTHLTLPTILLV